MASAPRPNDITSDRLAVGDEVPAYFEMADDPDEIEIIDADEDGAFADMPGERIEAEPPNEGFYDNLAKCWQGGPILDRISSELLRLIEMDKEARGKRDEQYEEGIKRTGMGKEAPGGAEFEGASRAVHPMITEACIDYQSRVMKELFPHSGPVKPSILGKVTKAKTDKAQRIADHMNWQITTQIKGARTTFEVLLAQVPLGGSQFIRQRWDHVLKRPEWQFASIDKVLVPFSAANFQSAKRKTFIDRVDMIEMRQRMASGMYLEIDLAMASILAEPTASEQASRKVEGLEDPGQNLDGDRDLYETMAYLELTDDMVSALSGTGGDEKAGDFCPYLITIDEVTKQVLSVYRAWEDKDPAREPLDHMFEFEFMPWKGPYAIGFPQLIGGLSAAATGALRGLLDSAHVNNTPSGLLMKGSGTSGQSVMPDPGTLKEIDVGTEADDIRKRVMPMPFNPPSQVLFLLLGFLVEAAKGVVRSSMDDTPASGMSANTPVGTQISRVEEGLVAFTAVHGRAHAALNRLLIGLHRLNRLYLPEEIKVDAKGDEILVRREDYEGPCDVMPVSDPTIFSETQRLNQNSYIQQRSLVNPQLYKQREVELAGLRLIKWPDPESLLNDVPQAEETNAVTENLRMSLGQPVEVFPEQDHLAHIQVLLDFMKEPSLGGNPLFAPIFMPAALHHAMNHIAYFYAEHTEKTALEAAGMTAEQIKVDEPEAKQAYDRLLAMASQKVLPEIGQALGGALPVLMQAMQKLQAMQPKPPVDPAEAAVQAAAAETQRKTQADQAGNQLDTAKLQSDHALASQKQTSDAEAKDRANQIAAAAVVAKEKGDEIRAQTDLETTVRDNATAIRISEEKIASGTPSRFSNGQSMT